jgi:predicted DNA-binding transcriptional regulator YafY
MRPADRLFQIIQILRRTPEPISAEALASELGTSKRTVYRDIADLIGQRVPVRGEAGVGYVLQPGLDLPPLMLTPDEIEAAVLGAQWRAPQRCGTGAGGSGSDRQDRRRRTGTASAFRIRAGD